ncbi:MAG: hypothetical protein M3416_07825 [Acidobacteriota bacterium]|nr:hypothetical protein [Acidobacteriota bacterium]
MSTIWYAGPAPPAEAPKQDGARRRIYNLRRAGIKENFGGGGRGGSGFYNAVKRNRRALSFFLHDFYNIRRPIVHNKSLSRRGILDFRLAICSGGDPAFLFPSPI